MTTAELILQTIALNPSLFAKIIPMPAHEQVQTFMMMYSVYLYNFHLVLGEPNLHFMVLTTAPNVPSLGDLIGYRELNLIHEAKWGQFFNESTIIQLKTRLGETKITDDVNFDLTKYVWDIYYDYNKTASIIQIAVKDIRFLQDVNDDLLPDKISIVDHSAIYNNKVTPDIEMKINNFLKYIKNKPEIFKFHDEVNNTYHDYYENVFNNKPNDFEIVIEPPIDKSFKLSQIVKNFKSDFKWKISW